ncbi:hypothetical protein [Endozoicomonas sp. Mp262]|uniref:hypothetical protein n=1 Tax=Endozoicomonas sp. Mp262 TaxID=2919499 RepID=UPI0021DAB7AD
MPAGIWFAGIADSKQLPFSNRISEEDIRITVCQITHEIWQLQLKEDMDKFNRANGFNLSPQELFPTYLKELQDLTGFSPEELREISPHLPSTIEIEPGLLPLIQKVVDAPIHIYSKGSYNIEVFDDDLWAEKAPHLNQFLKHRNESVRLTLFPPLSKSSTVALWQDFSKDNSCRYFCLTNHSFCNRKEGPKD